MGVLSVSKRSWPSHSQCQSANPRGRKGSAPATRVLPCWQGQSMGGTTLAGHGGLCCCLCWKWWWKSVPSVFIQAPMTIPAHPIPRCNSKRTGCQQTSMCVSISMKVGTWRVTSCHVPLSDAYDINRGDYSPMGVLWLHPDKHQTKVTFLSWNDIPSQMSSRHQRGIRARQQTVAVRIDTRTAETLLHCRQARQTAVALAERHRSIPCLPCVCFQTRCGTHSFSKSVI